MSRSSVWSLAVAMAVCGGASAPTFAQNQPFTVTQVGDFDILRAFTEACRAELRG